MTTGRPVRLYFTDRDNYAEMTAAACLFSRTVNQWCSNQEPRTSPNRDNMTSAPANQRAVLPIGKVDTPASLGALIRSRRKASGLGLIDAAGLAGVGVRFLSELERGKATASLGKTLLVLQRLGVELWIFPRGSGPRGGP